MAKGRGKRGREAKKPKGGNKPVQAAATFLPSPSAGAKPAVKEGNK
jgi:hypothetical protein